ncbi:protein ImuA [Parvibaculum indicum]|uniref:ImuA family protein n=1 Tax=Parvibaculum indicum TaxID=562969 RepID=UPI001422154A|nr:hypothetical protein [Parvibaculum indicum]NIJ41104.1 protein ImuA [Parvibaculum indicum]
MSKAAIIADLKARIAACEAPCAHGAEAAAPGPISLGHAALDAALPGGGLKRGGLHEVSAAEYRDMGAATGFLAALAVRCQQAAGNGMSGGAPLLWCQLASPPFDTGPLYAPGLAGFGLDPARLILASPAKPVELLWVLEEALRAGALSGVVGEIDGRSATFDLTATRRLQLAAEETGTPVLLFTGHRREGEGGASAAVTRWTVGPAPGHVDPAEDFFRRDFPGLVGSPCWHVRLGKVRGGAPAAWHLRWKAAEGAFDVAEGAAAEAVSPSTEDEATVLAMRRTG